MKILCLLPRFPYPLIKGDQLRAFYQLRELAHQHEVYVFVVTDVDICEEHRKALSFVKEIHVVKHSKIGIGLRVLAHFLKKEPFQVGYFYSIQAQRAFDAFISEVQPDVVFCQLVRMAKYCQGLPKNKLLLDYQDVFSKGLQRRIKESPWYFRFLLQWEYERMLRYEAHVFEQFKIKTIISEQDRQEIPHPHRNEIRLLPNGVDTQFFQATDAKKDIDMLFVGNMQYAPNIHCVTYLVAEVLPLLKEGDVHFYIVGASPTLAVRQLASPQITVTGYVEDTRTYYSRTQIFVAPMQIGIGMQNKILEAMAMGLPVITSSLCNNAIHAVDKEHLFICDTPESVAEAIERLLKNPSLRIEIGQNARTFIVKHYTWAAQGHMLSEWLTELCQT